MTSSTGRRRGRGHRRAACSCAHIPGDGRLPGLEVGVTTPGTGLPASLTISTWVSRPLVATTVIPPSGSTSVAPSAGVSVTAAGSFDGAGCGSRAAASVRQFCGQRGPRDDDPAEHSQHRQDDAEACSTGTRTKAQRLLHELRGRPLLPGYRRSIGTSSIDARAQRRVRAKARAASQDGQDWST